MKRIAFFGGSFDPPHRGHIAVAKAAADRFALDEILFAPVAVQPLKDYSPTPFVHRYAMTVLATQADPRFIPSLLDAPQSGTERPNYTVETLRRLRSSLDEETSLLTLLGADSWLQIAHWHDAAQLLTLCDWIVAARPGFSLATAESVLPPQVVAERDVARCSLLLRHANDRSTQVFYLTDTREDITATELRGKLKAGPVEPGLVAGGVGEYIRKTGIYGKGLR